MCNHAVAALRMFLQCLSRYITNGFKKNICCVTNLGQPSQKQAFLSAFQIALLAANILSFSNRLFHAGVTAGAMGAFFIKQALWLLAPDHSIIADLYRLCLARWKLTGLDYSSAGGKAQIAA